MRWAWLWVGIPIAFQFANGCVGPPFSQENIEIDVLGATSTAGSCLVGVQNASAECHLIEARITNHGAYNFTQMGQYNWAAIGDDGHIWRYPYVANESRVAPGENATTQLGFTVSRGTHLLRLDWSESTQTISTPIPGA